MQALTDLLEDHGHLIDLSDRLLDTVAAANAEPEQAHAELRDLAASLDRHLKVEDEVMRLARDSGLYRMIPFDAQRGEHFRTLVSDWVGYLDSWSAERVRREWTHFSRETLIILRRVKTQIESENEAVRMLSQIIANSN